MSGCFVAFSPLTVTFSPLTVTFSPLTVTLSVVTLHLRNPSVKIQILFLNLEGLLFLTYEEFVVLLFTHLYN